MELDEKFEKLLKDYTSKKPEIVYEWNDTETTAKGWVVINSLKNGAAGGGTRMRKGLTKDEVVALSKVMEIKFGISGPSIGGAKSGIDFDPTDPRKDDVLKRWFKAVYPLLKMCYGTGGDLNIDELKDVIPMTEPLGLWHPQEGVVNGHIRPNEGDKIRIINQLRTGVSKVVTDDQYVPVCDKEFAIADMVTGYGVAESIRHFYHIFHNEDLHGKRVIIQGWGNVAAAAGYYLSKMGTIIVGIIDKDGGLVEPDGMQGELIRNLFISKRGNTLNCDKLDFDTSNKQLWDVPCDIFIPAAASRLVSSDQVERLLKGGLKVIACGANVPFTDDEIFFGDTAKSVDKRISLIPDFVANCGMARVFAYLMQKNIKITDQSIFEDISSVIYRFLNDLYILDKSHLNISRRSLEKVIKIN
jgi:glutamate dehydrogenase/leucine dehydrogenase